MSNINQSIRTTNPRGEQESELPPRPASLPMYFASFVVTYCGLWAAAFVLNDPSFMMLVSSLAIIGFVASYICRVQNVPARNIEMPALILCIFVLALSFIGDPGTAFLAPSGVGEDRMRSLAVLLTWLTVFRSFTLISDGSLMFACVPTIALIGLVGTSNSDSQLVLDFIIFVVAAIFMVVHENMRSSDGHATVRSIDKSPNLWMSAQVALTAICVLASMFTANFIQPVIHQIGYYVRLTGGLPAAQTGNNAGPSKLIMYDNRQEVTDGIGPIKGSNEIVMTVRAPDAYYWRASTYSVYSGKGWSRISGSSGVLSNSNRPTSNALGVTDPLLTDGRYFETRPLPDTRVAAIFKMVKQRIKRKSSLVKEINGAGEIASIISNDNHINVDANGGLSFQEPKDSPQYEIVSYIPDWTTLTHAASPGNYPASISADNLSLAAISPDSLAAIRQQAHAVADSKTSQFERVQAIIAWIDTQCKYNLNASVNAGTDDTTTAFLFRVKQGYCDHFATALAVMCRSIDIPARIAVGYLPGELDSVNKEFVVRDKDRHRWTEVYFNGVGWMTFDATAGAADVTEEAAAADKQAKGFWSKILKKGIVPPILLGLVLVLVLYVVKVELFDRFRKTKNLFNSLGIPPTNYAVVLAWQNVEKQLNRLKLHRAGGETVSEFMLRLNSAIELTSDSRIALANLVSLFQDYRYGDIVASSSDISNANRSARAVCDELRTNRKIIGRKIIKKGTAQASA